MLFSFVLKCVRNRDVDSAHEPSQNHPYPAECLLIAFPAFVSLKKINKAHQVNEQSKNRINVA